MSGIRLSRAKASAHPPEISLNENIAISMDVKSKQVSCGKIHLVIEVDFRLTGNKQADNPKAKPVILVECSFEVSYQLNSGFEPSTEQIQAFKDGNAIFNCWPYCRQYVQDMVLRLGYPPITLPFLRVVTRPSKKRKAKKSE